MKRLFYLLIIWHCNGMAQPADDELLRKIYWAEKYEYNYHDSAMALLLQMEPAVNGTGSLLLKSRWLSQRAMLCYQADQHPLAFDMAEEALAIARRLADSLHIAKACLALAWGYDWLGDSLKASGYYEQVKQWAPATAEGRTTLGNSYSWQGFHCFDRDYFAASLAPARQSLQYYLQAHNYFAASLQAQELGNSYLFNGQYDSAVACYRRSIALSPHAAPNYFAVTKSYTGLCLLEERLGRLAAMPPLADSAAAYLAPIHPNNYSSYVLEVVSRSYAYNHFWEKAYQAMRLSNYALQRKWRQQRASGNATAAVKLRQELNLAQTTGELNRQKNTRNIVVFATVFALALAFLGYRAYRRQKKLNTIIQQQRENLESLLQEVHHRVKNNLQIISGLLYMQFGDAADAVLKSKLAQARQRIKSMTLVHNKLYEKDDRAHVYLKEYIQELGADVLHAFTPAGKTISLDIDERFPVRLSLNASIAAGLILNEVITNSCKYAFTNRAEGRIHITINKEPDNFVVIVQDDGTGLPDNFEQKKSLGVTLIKNLCLQMDGSAAFENNNGATVTIRFTDGQAA